MSEEADGQKKISLERAIYLLKKDGIIVSDEQAKCLLGFLSVMADIVVSQYLRKFQKER